VRISWKILGLALIAAGSMLLAGCGGLAASQTISPLDFLLPGILRADPPSTNAPVMVAQASLEITAIR
jgi:hypothetical protein